MTFIIVIITIIFEIDFNEFLQWSYFICIFDLLVIEAVQLYDKY